MTPPTWQQDPEYLKIHPNARFECEPTCEAAVAAYKRTLKTRIEELETVRDQPYCLFKDAVLAVLEDDQ